MNLLLEHGLDVLTFAGVLYLSWDLFQKRKADREAGRAKRVG